MKTKYRPYRKPWSSLGKRDIMYIPQQKTIFGWINIPDGFGYMRFFTLEDAVKAMHILNNPIIPPNDHAGTEPLTNH